MIEELHALRFPSGISLNEENLRGRYNELLHYKGHILLTIDLIHYVKVMFLVSYIDLF